MNRILIILGPTSTGKTDLALQLAQKFNGELISCDSRQVYKGLDIGTGKQPSSKLKVKSSKLKKGKGYWEIDGIKVWMYDVISPKIQYNVASFIDDAGKVIKDIHKRGKLPILVGGTGLYLKAILYGLSNLSIPVDQKLRKELEQLTLSQLQEKLKHLSLEKWNSLNNSDNQNPRRLIRAIELVLSKPIKNRLKIDCLPAGKAGLRIKNDDFLKIGLTSSTDFLYQRSDQRVISRIKQGMIDEAIKLHKQGLSFKRMKQLGLEYGVLADYLQDNIKSEEEFSKILQTKIHQFIKRQITWFKKGKDVNWFDMSTSHYLAKIEKLVSDWYT